MGCETSKTATGEQQPLQTDETVPQSHPDDASKKEEEPPQYRMIRALTRGPLDASDVVDLATAQIQLRLARRHAKAYLDQVYAELDNLDGEEVCNQDGGENDSPLDQVGIRDALYDKQDFESFRKVTHAKTDDVRILIYEAMRLNELFGDNTEEEMLEIIDIFEPRYYGKGGRVIEQGTEGTEFYVVESGQLSIEKSFGVLAGDEQQGPPQTSNIHIGEYTEGSSFGEMALIFGTPRATTVTAIADCRLWSLDSVAYVGLISKLRHDQHIQKKEFLRSCVVREQRFEDIFDEPQIEDLAIATKVYSYEKGDIIVREGEIGDTFFIVKSGTVEALKKGKPGQNTERTVTIEEKQAFGTSSLLRGVKSSCTYVAASQTTLYYLTKADFEKIMGSFSDLLDGNDTIATRSASRKTVDTGCYTSMTMDRRYDLTLDELIFYNVLGRGAFGRVTLVQGRGNKKVFALKAQSKDCIVKRRKQEHVMNEYRIMKECHHPNVLGMHCAMQDKSHIYFLVDLVPGGELMKHFLQRKKFSEDMTRFYAASVVLAFEYLHIRDIAYRDLKPENLVLDRNGYVVLVDFGLAKEIVNGQSYTFCGTPGVPLGNDHKHFLDDLSSGIC